MTTKNGKNSYRTGQSYGTSVNKFIRLIKKKTMACFVSESRFSLRKVPLVRVVTNSFC
jgi:hypothetical protein